MAKITKEQLLDKEVLEQRLNALSEQVKKQRSLQGELVDKQAKILSKKIEEFKPLMQFFRENGFYFTHPTLDVHSSRGAILDFDQEEQELYVFDLEDNWIKKVNLFNQDAENIPDFIFVQKRNLKNAIDGLNHLLTIEDRAFEGFSEDISKRANWIKENE